MYVPHFNAADEAFARDLIARLGAAELVTTGEDGYPASTLLPIMWDGEVVRAHLARANPHWHGIGEDQPALLICAGPQAYITPSWYAAKAEHGRVVPTWNYSAVHLRGRARIIEDPAWLLSLVQDLTNRHEDGREHPWQVDDAPAGFVEKMLRGIVGVEVRVEQVEAKAKWSQNRSEDDVRGVLTGLHGTAAGAEMAQIFSTGA